MSDGNRLVVLNHTHTPFSNGTEREYKGLSTVNHRSDYARIADNMPEDLDLAFTVTNHCETEGISYWEELQRDVQGRGGEAYLDNMVFRGEIDGTRIYGLHGVEAADENCLDHEFLIHGLALDDSRNHTYDGLDEMLEETENAELGTVPHPFHEEFDWGSDKREDLFELASNYDAELSFEYAHGYGFVNHVANGTWFSDQDVGDLCNKYNVPAIPGVDLHSSMPKQVSVMDYSAVDRLEDDEFPFEQFRDMSVVRKPGKMPAILNNIRDTAGAIVAYSGSVPLAGGIIPNTEETHRKLSKTTEGFISEIDAEKIEQNAVRVNGGDGLLGNPV